MSGLIDSARGILADLVRKRLWPIAVALLVAVVAIPVLLAPSSSSEAPAPDGGVAAVAPQPAPVTDDATPQARDEPAGRVRDPIFDPPPMASGDTAAKPAPAATSAAEPARGAATKADDKPAAPAKAKPTSPDTQPAPATPASPAPVTGTYHRTAARLGAGSTTRPLARLTPVGDRANPAALYLGVMKVGRPYAVFVLGSRATSRGDATCAAATDCRVIGLRPGDRQTITLHTAHGRTARRFSVRVASVAPVTTSVVKARAIRAAVHSHGRSAMRAMSRSRAVAGALGRLGYRPGSGLLYSVGAAEALEKATR